MKTCADNLTEVEAAPGRRTHDQRSNNNINT